MAKRTPANSAAVGQEIPEGMHLVAGSSGGNRAGPARNERHSDTAVVEIPLNAAKRPAALEELRLVSALLMGAVVAGEDDQGVLLLPGGLERGEQSPDVGIHAGNERGEVALHLGPRAVLIRLVVGRLHAVPAESGQLVVRVGNGVGQVEEERLPGAGDELQGSFGEQVIAELLALVEPVAGEERLVLIVPEVLGVGVVGVLLIQVSVEFVESASVRDAAGAGAAESPFSEQSGSVARALEEGGNRGLIRPQTRFGLDVAADGGVAGMPPGHQAAAGRSTDGGTRIRLGEAKSLGGHAVQIRGLDLLLTITPEIAVAEIIGEDKNDVGPEGGSRACLPGE